MPGSSGNPEGKGLQRPSIVRLALLFYGALGAVALLWAFLAGRSIWFASADAAAAGGNPLRDAGVGALAGALVVGISRLVTRHTGWGDALARTLAAALGRLSLVECVLLAAVSGVAEEALFRGALQPQVGLLAASVLFAAAHFLPRRELLPWTAFAFLAGLLLGALFERTGNLLAPIVAHALLNAVNLRFLTRHYGAAGEQEGGRRG
jgi:membrane protease YdiL (CAAX protease family)